MNRQPGLLLYNEPATGPLTLLTMIIPGGLLVGSIYLWFTGQSNGAEVLLSEAAVLGVIFWLVFPRRYQIYEDKLRVVLGGPLAVNIGFDQIGKIEVTPGPSFSVNFTTRFRWRYIRITRKRGLSIAITPRSNEEFVERASRVLAEWKRTGSR